MELKESFTRVIKEHEGLIFKVTTLYTYDHQDRKDLYQEIVYQLWKSFSSFSNRSKISTWMYRIALNTAIYHLKRSKKQVSTTGIGPELELLAEDMDNNDAERINLLYTHIHRLNLLEKGIMLLYLEGKSHEEIAPIIGIAVSNVGTRISRIKGKLKNQLSKA